MQSHGMEYSFSLEKHQQNFPGSGMIRAFRRAVSQQNSTSRGQPRLRQVWDIDHFFLFQLTDAHKFITWYDFMENL